MVRKRLKPDPPARVRGRHTKPAGEPPEPPRGGLARDPRTSARLRAIRRENTAAEQRVRQAAYALGLRFRLRNRDLFGSPDLANRSKRWALFVHGCFWHHHAGCRRATVPKRNRRFWQAKFASNRARDRRVVRQLRRAGFFVATVWECQSERATVVRRRLQPLLRHARGKRDS